MSVKTWKDAADESDRDSLALTFSYTVGDPPGEPEDAEGARCLLGDRFFKGFGLETQPVAMREK